MSEEKKGRKSDVAFQALLGLLITYYMLTNLFSNSIDVFFPELSNYLSEPLMKLGGLIALSFVVLTFVLAVKERNKGLLVIYALFFMLIVASAVLHSGIIP